MALYPSLWCSLLQMMSLLSVGVKYCDSSTILIKIYKDCVDRDCQDRSKDELLQLAFLVSGVLCREESAVYTY